MNFLCGTVSNELNAIVPFVDGTQVLQDAGETQIWSLDSQTGVYTFKVIQTFEDYSWWSPVTKEITLEWQQGCVIQVSQAEIVSFTEADFSTNTSASADMFMQGAVFGDCGG